MLGLKIAISGKGGVGKSTLAAVWARLLAARGVAVLAVDADPDANLGAALGMPAQSRERIRPLSEEARLVEERTGARAGSTGQLFSLNPKVSDIAQKYSVSFADVNLLVLGAVRRGGGGCACPESTLLKSLVRHLVIGSGEAVILDMEAGVEHLGRATAAGVDCIVAVVEPGTRSIDTALTIQKLSHDIGLGRRLALIMNKGRDQDSETASVTSALPGVPVLGWIPNDELFVSADLNQTCILDMPGSVGLRARFGDALGALERNVAQWSSERSPDDNR